MVELSDTHRHLARHALGLPNLKDVAYRNHYVTGPGAAHDAWMDMVEHGFAKFNIDGNSTVFQLTWEGAVAALDDGEGLEHDRRYARAEVAHG